MVNDQYAAELDFKIEMAPKIEAPTIRRGITFGGKTARLGIADPQQVNIAADGGQQNG